MPNPILDPTGATTATAMTARRIVVAWLATAVLAGVMRPRPAWPPE